MTNAYCFLDVDGESFNDISQVSCTIFSKSRMKKLVEEDAGKSIEDIKADAEELLGSSRKWIGYGDFCLYKSMPDKLASSPVVNLCFDREKISMISKKAIVKKVRK